MERKNTNCIDVQTANIQEPYKLRPKPHRLQSPHKFQMQLISSHLRKQKRNEWLSGAHAAGSVASGVAGARASSDGGSALASAERDLTKSRRRRLTSLE